MSTLRTTWTRSDGATKSGTPCSACGKTYSACSRKVFGPRPGPCCTACGFTDTHDERPEPVTTTAPDATDTTYLFELITALTERVSLLEAANAPKGAAPDPITEKIIRFMQGVPGMKLTALNIAENIDENNSAVGSRLHTLESRGTIRSVKREGRTRMFYWPADLGVASPA